MDMDGIKALTEDHFRLLNQKQEIEHTLKRTQNEVVGILVKAGAFEFFTVNWARLNRAFVNRR